MEFKRCSGILMPISSLPGGYGIGSLGKPARDFVDFLAGAGQTIWQILPVGPTGFADSPYQSCSAFAGNPYFIDLDLLAADGLLTPKDYANINWGSDAAKVDYGTLYEKRFAVLRKAYRRFLANRPVPGYETPYPDDWYRFQFLSRDWLPDYCLYMAIKEANGMVDWQQWPRALRVREAEALAAFRAEHAEELEFWAFVQYEFDRQWRALHAYAKEKGIAIMGDIPIYVSADSADAWAGRELFETDAEGRPRRVAGCPPDYFAEDGQLWGNPLYDWERMRQTDYAWWKERIAAAARLFDVIRIDHFRGLESYWAIPYGDKTARGGKWVKGPGHDFVRAMQERFPDLRLIAEDLGFLTDDVIRLQKDSGWPGMKVLEFAFDSREPSNYLPHRYIRNCICYSGTHDNETLAQWLAQTSETARAYAAEYLGLTEQEGYAWGILRSGLASVADTFIAQLQDYLGLGAEARMNTPGTLSDRNWSWRLQPGLLTAELAHRLRRMNTMYERL